MGANADGSHRLPPVVCGKSARPRALKDCMASLPVPYHSSGKGWFNAENLEETFFKHIVPAIIRHQKEVLKISEERIRTLILLDNAPAHPSKGRLVAHNGKIRVLFLPTNTTSLIQPMDQGVIHTTKLIYRRLFLSEVLVVEETPEDLVEDTRGLRTLEKLKAYNIKQAIFNFSEAWKQVRAALSLMPGRGCCTTWMCLLSTLQASRSRTSEGCSMPGVRMWPMTMSKIGWK